ncbi:MAG: hypothetical protein B7Z14_12845, partial [Bosea sp. 32-68-6]
MTASPLWSSGLFPIRRAPCSSEISAAPACASPSSASAATISAAGSTMPPRPGWSMPRSSMASPCSTPPT